MNEADSSSAPGLARQVCRRRHGRQTIGPRLAEKCFHRIKIRFELGDFPHHTQSFRLCRIATSLETPPSATPSHFSRAGLRNRATIPSANHIACRGNTCPIPRAGQRTGHLFRLDSCFPSYVGIKAGFVGKTFGRSLRGLPNNFQFELHKLGLYIRSLQGFRCR